MLTWYRHGFESQTSLRQRHDGQGGVERTWAQWSAGQGNAQGREY